MLSHLREDVSNSIFKIFFYSSFPSGNANIFTVDQDVLIVLSFPPPFCGESNVLQPTHPPPVSVSPFASKTEHVPPPPPTAPSPPTPVSARAGMPGWVWGGWGKGGRYGRGTVSR